MSAEASTDDTGLGLPSDDPNPDNSVSTLSNPNGAQSTGLISTLEGWGTSAFSDVESAASSTVAAVGSGLSSAYSGVKNAGSSAIGTVEGVVGFGTSQIVLLAVVAIVGIYIAGKAGVFKALI